MTVEERIQRIGELKAEFQRLVEFHETSFREIDAKAKYWLTAALPSFIALAGYLFKHGDSLALPLLVSGCALATCLFIAVYLFSSVLLSLRVESGILTPKSRQFDDAECFIKTSEDWAELCELQAQELLDAITINETQNAQKSTRLRRSEVALFRAVPTGICLAGGSAFAYAAACPSGLATTGATAAGTVAGIAIGAGTAAAFVALDHVVTRRKKDHQS
ncbi:hypothetical protein SAMN05444398_1011059 [Roseovarius pacificus]|uniref:Uncharacterized protein n=1 Tax=Roseovarius pacificus TaxID=337701 RepID=A0A1M6YVV8_9RHOB|nr:hypothetical protein [Roseovarius pacificus]GGO50303.1 hypothetical protein GCM10011315_00750 [Roseovarius pacificus]SHL22378.1 hypothetical protein SAMN05444398_1011059 [Roseovarius pacificus]